MVLSPYIYNTLLSCCCECNY